MAKQFIWIRRGYGAFVRCKSEPAARKLAAHWHRTGQGVREGDHQEVIGLFIGDSQYPSQAKRTQLYPVT